MKKIIAASLLFAALPAAAELKFYSKYENEVYFLDQDYVENSALNSARVGMEGDHFYLEAGTVVYDGEVGASYEAGYKFPFWNNFEVRGEVEGFQVDSFEGDVYSRVETELRYYF